MPSPGIECAQSSDVAMNADHPAQRAVVDYASRRPVTTQRSSNLLIRRVISWSVFGYGVYDVLCGISGMQMSSKYYFFYRYLWEGAWIMAAGLALRPVMALIMAARKRA